MSEISAELEAKVRLQAKNRCGYCRIAIEDTYFGGEVDHIISSKHCGQTISSKLALPVSLVTVTRDVT